MLFAEFELRTHQMEQDGESLTYDVMSELWQDLSKKYNGENIEILEIGNISGLTVPHFYDSFYCYQYTTGFAAAMALVERIKNGGENELEQYIQFLHAGKSDYPIQLLQNVGVDMNTTQPLDTALEKFAALVNELDEIINVKGKVICLNGVSSSGKSTLAKALQDKLPAPYYLISEDIFTFMLPEKFNGFINDTTENEPIWEEALVNYYNVIKLYSDRGYNVIVDTVLDDEMWLNCMIDRLLKNPVLFVHVTCPKDELIKREQKRGDREIGMAVGQLAYLCPKEPIYDITVDTHAHTTEECAHQIATCLGNVENFQAFNTLWAQRAK
jgi:chloramphenicol 3-O-phosphotransferase